MQQIIARAPGAFSRPSPKTLNNGTVRRGFGLRQVNGGNRMYGLGVRYESRWVEMRDWSCCSASDEAMLADGDDGGSGGDSPTDSKSTAEDDGGENVFGEKNVLVAALIKGGSKLSELPLDMQAALQNGLLTLKDVERWLDVTASPLLGALCKSMPGVRDRVMGNPRFLLQVCLELALGLTAKTVAEYNARGDKFFKEMPFVLSDLALEALGDFSLVWLLSPTKTFKPLPSGKLARSVASLPGHCLQSGPFTLGQRAATILYRGGQFFLVGFGTSLVGHSITKWAVENQEGPKEDVHLAPVLDNSVGWGSFMAMSSNVRYQTVNCLEERVLDAFIPNRFLNAGATFVVRFSNCFVGGVQWIWFAKQTGLQ